ncbi:hypothetical protein SAMN04515624_10489 [Eubacterium maltosivorans]|uniref:DUF2798 domain-containing protein n=1 Tax=Eubacterium maltosivorans TaxID=2041044 RepID=UPI000889157C|nr:DUF2798 domain-containing protein [Eubacterium maltosivorans]WPK80152.1 hypothetical protein EUMA32_15640 [Eubacterium maltosivorans]SDO82425.1 hypothetical protein SAMN04515624_10489 [Eubacterium maltosivorans]
MPKTKLQNVIFTLLMALVMVYALICYNIALDKGGLSNAVFLLAFHELTFMWPIAVILELFVVEKLAQKLAFRIIAPESNEPIFIVFAISAITVCLMCPMMSLVATVLFKNPGSEIIAVWLQTTVMNFPMALFWQIFFAGPCVRFVFRMLFRKQMAEEFE